MMASWYETDDAPNDDPDAFSGCIAFLKRERARAAEAIAAAEDLLPREELERRRERLERVSA